MDGGRGKSVRGQGTAGVNEWTITRLALYVSTLH